MIKMTNAEFFEKYRAQVESKFTEKTLVKMMLTQGNKEDREYIHKEYPELILKYPELLI